MQGNVMTKLQKDLVELFTQALNQFTTESENFTYLDHKIGSDIFILNHLGFKIKCNMKDIITNLNYPPSTATRKVNKLVDLGYIKRLRPRDNRRSVELRLTNKGRDIFARFHEQRFDPLLKVFKEFSNEHLENFYAILQRIIEK